MKIFKKAQPVIEYIFVIVLTLVILVPTAYLVYRYTTGSKAEIEDSQISKIGREIIDTAEVVYYSGEGSKAVLDLNMPEGILEVKVMNKRELVFNMSSGIGETEMVFFSELDIALVTTDTDNDCTVNDNCVVLGFGRPGLRKLTLQTQSDGSGGTEILLSSSQG